VAGRSSQRTAANADDIIQEIEAGATRKVACACVGMSTDTLNRWEDADASFAARLARAEGIRNRSLVADIRKEGPKDWRAAAWLLERVDREGYGTKQDHTVSNPDGSPLTLVINRPPAAD
jgi:hypothetical protein